MCDILAAISVVHEVSLKRIGRFYNSSIHLSHFQIHTTYYLVCKKELSSMCQNVQNGGMDFVDKTINFFNFYVVFIKIKEAVVLCCILLHMCFNFIR